MALFGPSKDSENKQNDQNPQDHKDIELKEKTPTKKDNI